MRKILAIFIAVLSISCGKISPKGDIEQKQIPLKAFSTIEGKGKFRIFWVKSPQNMLEIETYPNFIENLEINQENNILKIKENRETQGMGFYNITLFSQYDPKNIILSDSIEFNVSGNLKIENFKLSLDKNSKFIGAVDTKKMKVEMQNQSLANFKGFTDEVELNIKDTAQVVAPYLVGNVLSINAKNGSFAELTIQDTIKGELKNTSKLWYYDTPVFKVRQEKGTEVVKHSEKK